MSELEDLIQFRESICTLLVVQEVEGAELFVN